MIVLNPSYCIIDALLGVDILQKLETIGRICYKSEGRMTDDSYAKFIRNKIDLGHESIIEHESLTVKFWVDRGVTHEMVRHRIASFTQESTRYCNYADEDKFYEGIAFIDPRPAMELDNKCRELDAVTKAKFFDLWMSHMELCETNYNMAIEMGVTPQIARDLLPNALKAEIFITMNLREWRHFFRMRATAPAHPKMREVALPLLFEFKKEIPVIFDDIKYDEIAAKRLGLI